MNALKEIFQEIALLGLWRAKFYEKAAFYGGSALRILYGLDRFSEDLDFTLLRKDNQFQLAAYNQAVVDELASFGFDVEVECKNKKIISNIESAFIKADTKKQLIIVEAPSDISKRFHHMHRIRIKMEVDVRPPGKFNTEAKTILQPIPFSVRTLILPDLFAGKIHALLCRPWQLRVKGRDWYDFVWCIGRDIPVNTLHLRERLVQSEAWKGSDDFGKDELLELLKNKIKSTDFENAKRDIKPFLSDPKSTDIWSTPFFNELLDKIKIIQ